MTKFFLPLIALFALLVAGCNQTDKSLEAEDETNPHIRDALTAQREFNYVDSAKAYEAALQACPTVARAHFDLGLLYADRLNDPIRAMYHFQCYIDQRPQADNREGAQKRLDSIKIQFAATVPNSPIQNAEAFAKLQADNQNLLKDLDDARAQITTLEAKSKVTLTDTVDIGTSGGAAPNSTPINPVKDTPDVKSDLGALSATSDSAVVTPSPSSNSTDSAASSVAPTPTPNPAQPPPSTTANTAPSSSNTAPSVTTTPPVQTPNQSPSAASTPANPDRTHTIAKGDTLWSIAKKYYPGQITAGIEKIKNANPDKLPEGRPLKIGVVLTVP